MNKTSSIFVAIGALLLILVFFFPLWAISLDAPQYPEGLGLKIWVNNISGDQEFDLQNINCLNHYIGMKAIEPGSFAELKIMPYILIFMIGFGLLNSFLRSRKLVYAWLILFGLLGVAGMYVFYAWSYDYGHNLDPEAPIKIPGMSYQPPIFGSKQLLNIYALSLPSIATIIIAISVMLNMMALYIGREKKTA